MRRLAVLAIAGLLAGGGLAGCTSSAPRAEVDGPFRTCDQSAPASGAAPAAGTATPLAGSSASGGPAASGAAASPVPAGSPNSAGTRRMAAVTLPCFAGGAPVRLDALGRPAVLNLWASWCGPCRSELPVFQQLADASAGSVAVLGVVTGDSRTAAASFAEDVAVTFPSVYDRDSAVQRSGLMPIVLPVTLFVDGQGRVRHVEPAPIPNLSTLEGLVAQYLGVRL